MGKWTKEKTWSATILIVFIMIGKTKKNSDKSAGTSKDKSKTVPQVSDLQFETFVVHSAKYQTLLTQKFKNRKKWQPNNEKHILSFIPGTILKVSVKDGEKVQKDKPLLILEAMKMENTIFSPFTGVVKKVFIKEGDRIPKGQLLLEFE